MLACLSPYYTDSGLSNTFIKVLVRYIYQYAQKTLGKALDDTGKTKWSGKRTYPTASVKYLGVKINQNFTWQHHINYFSVKLNIADDLLFKIRKFVDDKILWFILLFLKLLCLGSKLEYHCLVILQKKALRIMNFEPQNPHTSPLFRKTTSN